MSRARILVFNAGSRRILFPDRVKSRARKNERDRIGINLNPTPESQASAYVMGRTSEEYERSRRQAELLEPITASVFARVGLCTGMCCLDVGCGPGEVMLLMAERVGPTARSWV